MEIAQLGQPTYFTRVEAWDCDHNGHWNARHYLRCFQQAGHVAADLAGQPPSQTQTFHARFHRELLEMATVEVRSATLADGDLAGATVHLLISGAQVSATALEQPGHGAGLPPVAAADVALALPRGIDGGRHTADAPPEPEGAMRLEYGIVQPGETDHTGTIGLDHMTGRIAAASSALLGGLGLTPDYTRETGISRMGVETRMTRLTPIPAGTRLSGTVRVASVARKSLILRHVLSDGTGARVGVVDQSLVTVDLTTRRAVELPEFLARAAG